MTVFPLNYIKIVDAIKSYTIAIDGLLSNYEGIDQSRAEDIAAWSGHFIRTATGKLNIKSPLFVVLESPDEDYAILEFDDQIVTVVTKPGYGYAVARALSRKGPKCGKCGEDLSLAVVRCPRCGANNPFTAEKCSKCGYTLWERRCPRCGAKIDVNGRPISLKDKLLTKTAVVQQIYPTT